MAHISLVLAGVVGVSYLVFRFLDSVLTSHRRAARAREWGCDKPRQQALRLPLGIDKVRAAIAADQRKHFLQFLVAQAEQVGRWTFMYRIFGTEVITTHEPQNIQALLATQFGTFELGEQRRNMVCFWNCLPWPLP